MSDTSEYLFLQLARLFGLYAALGVLLTIVVVVLAKFRGAKEKAATKPAEMLGNFREMHAQGDLSDEEYRTIKAKLAADIQRALKDTDQPG